MATRFKCRYTDCAKSYIRKEHLTRHEKDHADDRPFGCHLCASSFKRRLADDASLNRTMADVASRRDILSRHLALSHGQSQKERPQGISDTVEDATVKNGETRTRDAKSHTESRNKADIIATSVVHDQTGSRDFLTDLYFDQFHPHWPVLNRQTFSDHPQPPELLDAVHVAGSMMADTPEHRSEVRARHEELLQVINRKLVSLVYGFTSEQKSRHNNLRA